jgi:hypothetical protein
MSQPIFAFQWEDNKLGGQQQLTQTHLPQGIKNYPTIFGTALASDYEHTQQRELAAHSYLLLAVANHQDSLKGTEVPLCLLWEAGYKVCQKKAQDLPRPGHLGTIRKQAVCSILTPTSRRQICKFLGVAGLCQIWIPIFPLLTKPLYKTTKGEDKREPLIWKSK